VKQAKVAVPSVDTYAAVRIVAERLNFSSAESKSPTGVVLLT